MEAVLLVIHLFIALAIIVVVLVQPSESGGFLGSSGSMSNLMAQRRSVHPLARATGILAACFFTTSLLLAIVASHRPEQKSILDALPAQEQPQPKPAAAPAPALDKKIDDKADVKADAKPHTP